jgi:hypothetical protein
VKEKAMAGKADPHATAIPKPKAKALCLTALMNCPQFMQFL